MGTEKSNTEGRRTADLVHRIVSQCIEAIPRLTPGAKLALDIADTAAQAAFPGYLLGKQVYGRSKKKGRARIASAYAAVLVGIFSSGSVSVALDPSKRVYNGSNVSVIANDIRDIYPRNLELMLSSLTPWPFIISEMGRRATNENVYSVKIKRPPKTCYYHGGEFRVVKRQGNTTFQAGMPYKISTGGPYGTLSKDDAKTQAEKREFGRIAEECRAALAHSQEPDSPRYVPATIKGARALDGKNVLLKDVRIIGIANDGEYGGAKGELRLSDNSGTLQTCHNYGETSAGLKAQFYEHIIRPGLKPNNTLRYPVHVTIEGRMGRESSRLEPPKTGGSRSLAIGEYSPCLEPHRIKELSHPGRLYHITNPPGGRR